MLTHPVEDAAKGILRTTTTDVMQDSRNHPGARTRSEPIYGPAEAIVVRGGGLVVRA
jgi:hypothetical protein